jgi:phage-related protein (TIGR01555 family)
MPPLPQQPQTYMDRARGWALDSLTNFLAGIGVEGRDKGVGSEYRLSILTPDQLEFAFRGDWIARKVVQLPAFDMTREWRSWQADDDQILALEKIERDFNIKLKMQDAILKARLYGGSCMLLGVKDGEGAAAMQPLDVTKIGKDDLKFLHVLTKYEVGTGPRIYDLLSPWYGQPEYYEATQQTLAAGRQIRVHPSRVIRFVGLEYPSISTAPDTWGDSALQPVDDAIKASGLVSGSLATLISELKVDIIKTPGLSEQLATPASTKKVIDRFSKSNVAKSIVNTLLLDKNEEWTRLQTTLAGIPEVLQVYLMIASGAADIPATRFLGRSPAGLNSTGESDVRNYYDRLKSEQTTHLTPNVSILDQIIQRTALGDYDEAITYTWNSLWQSTEAEKSDIALKKAQAFKIDADAGLIPTVALAHARVSQLNEDGFYPGLQQALDDAEENGDTIETQNEPPPPNLPLVDPARQTVIAGQPPVRMLPPPTLRGDSRPRRNGKRKNGQPLHVDRRRIKDMQPKPLYVYRELINKTEFVKWAREQGFDKPVDDPHVTIVYSRSPVDWMEMGTDSGWSNEDDGSLRVSPGGPRFVDTLGDEGAVVLFFLSNRLTYRHNDMVDRGASHDYDEYMPHVTITYDGKDVELRDVEPYIGELVFGPETFQEIEPGGYQPNGGGQDHFPFV